jgi:hypothetical protein
MMKDWLDRRPAAAWFLVGVLAGVALILLMFEQRRDPSEGGSQSYYSQF